MDKIKAEPKKLMLPLFALDFEENTITLKVPEEIMKKGFHAGYVEVDLSGVQK